LTDGAANRYIFYQMQPRRRPAGAPVEDFQEFQASVLFCGRCRAPRPVRERLLLVLPDGELHEYLCSACGSSVGTRKVTGAPPLIVV
jgi:hypothetical protein